MEGMTFLRKGATHLLRMSHGIILECQVCFISDEDNTKRHPRHFLKWGMFPTPEIWVMLFIDINVKKLPF